MKQKTSREQVENQGQETDQQQNERTEQVDS